jgi:ATP-dependent DNA helicase RecQ
MASPRFGRNSFGVRYNARRALELLRLGTEQRDASFRTGQEEAVRHVVNGEGPLLLVQKTGWGKSNVYFIAAKLLREAGQGPTLLISPLLALMRSQIEAAERMGVRAVTINSDNTNEWNAIESRIRDDLIDVLLISPERLANQSFFQDVLAPMSDRIALLVIDEAHCISDWGHDFRPDYRRIERIIGTLPPNLRLLGTTATANNRVLADLRDTLGSRLTVQRGGLARPSLLLQTVRLPNQAQRLAWLAERLREVPGSGIIYTLTVRDAERVADWLRLHGFPVEAYTGQTGDRRPELEQALLDNRVKALAATTALGMGFDKPDLAFVFHYQAPGSVIHYYQQVGRAGRALDAAYGVLLSGKEDTDITSYFMRTAFPTRGEVAEVHGALDEAPDGLSVQELTHRVNISPGRIRNTLKLLSLESPAPIALDGRRWQLVAAELTDAFWERVERLTALRYREQAQMQEYVDLRAGQMEFLIDALDGESSALTPPGIEPLSTTVDPRLIREAVTFLQRANLRIEPRRRWPGGGRPELQQSLQIPADLQAEPGRALCLWGDADWGDLVRHGKYQDQRFADELVDACAKLVREWMPAPAPMWVTAVPSRRRPTLVPNFAERLAKTLDLPFRVVLGRTKDHQEQKEMENSVYQARNVWESLVVNSSLPAGPLLLVDDIVDSRWTMTVAAYKLRSDGSDEVVPMALSLAGGVA